MDKPEQKQTHDFMNVESFSQLPFIRRPAPFKEKGIKLFGKEFGSHETPTKDESESTDTNNAGEDTRKDGNNTSNNGESSRRFECHYCCRNFPTSQALGGHQNAHKRERQHAKRAHLQQAMAHSSFSDAHVYGLMNYRLGGSVQTPAMAYPSWNNAGRFYGGHGSYSQPSKPINGSPLAAKWRIPTVQSSTNSSGLIRGDGFLVSPLSSMFGGDELKVSAQVGLSIGSSTTTLSRYVFESKPGDNQDHVSLDLHL